MHFFLKLVLNMKQKPTTLQHKMFSNLKQNWYQVQGKNLDVDY